MTEKITSWQSSEAADRSNALAWLNPDAHLPVFKNTLSDRQLLAALRGCLAADQQSSCPLDQVENWLAVSSFPKDAQRISLYLYAPGHERIQVTRATDRGMRDFVGIFTRLLQHPRRVALTVTKGYRLQMDFVTVPPQSVEYLRVGMKQRGERHFEIGVDGFLIKGQDDKINLFSPGDAYVYSIIRMRPLRRYLARRYGETYLQSARFERYRCQSYLSTDDGWINLYRGIPVLGALKRKDLERAILLAIDHVQRNQGKDGQFLHYYDPAKDAGQDPDQRTHYNILRHSAGALACLYYETCFQRKDARPQVRAAIGYLLTQLRICRYGGREGAYVYGENESELSGAGLGLYLIVKYEWVTGDAQYRCWADRLAWRLLHHILPGDDFPYYNINHDRPVTETEKDNHSLFHDSGETLCGLAQYLKLLPVEQRKPYFTRLTKALCHFLETTPTDQVNADTEVSSASWPMVAVMELWDFDEMQIPEAAEFVFTNAAKMMDRMYKVTEAPYPDYAGGLYGVYGDYPHADSARCVGLAAAYELAHKMGDHRQMRYLWRGMRLAAWAIMHLVNSPDAIYAAPNPQLALGGVRFKYTRQWFRIDSIQHLVSFYSRMLPYWQAAEAQSTRDFS
jgi:hypothetical protein